MYANLLCVDPDSGQVRSLHRHNSHTHSVLGIHNKQQIVLLNFSSLQVDLGDVFQYTAVCSPNWASAALARQNHAHLCFGLYIKLQQCFYV